MRLCASRIAWRPGPAKDGVSGALNEKTLKKGALWHKLSRRGPCLLKDAHFPCFHFTAR
jgi:hypothetical protein